MMMSLAEKLGIKRAKTRSQNSPTKFATVVQPRTLNSTRAVGRRTIQCAICCEDVVAPCPRPTLSCAHKPTACADCLQKHIKEEVLGKNRSTIMCPTTGCNAAFTINDIKGLCGAKVTELLDRNLLNEYLKTQRNFRWCAHAGCGSGQLVEGGSDTSFFTCHQCSRMTCVRHRTIWHTGRTCDKHDRWLQECTTNGEKDLAWIRANCTSCPKCGHGIQKDGGCDHMTCRKTAGGCGHEFCWRCGANYALIRKHDNSYHKPTCMYYSPA